MKKIIVFMALAFVFGLIFGQLQFAEEANTIPDTPAYKLVGSLYKV